MNLIDRAHSGGAIVAALHIDFVLPHTVLMLDGETAIANGKRLIR